MRIPRRSGDFDRFMTDQLTRAWASIADLQARVLSLEGGARLTARPGVGLVLAAKFTNGKPIAFNPADPVIGFTVTRAVLTLFQPVKIDPPNAAVGLVMRAVVTKRAG